MCLLFEAVIAVKFSSVREAEAALRSLAVESFSQPTEWVKAEVSLRGDTLLIKLSSSRHASLRAGANSFLRLLSAIECTQRELTQDT